MSESKKHSDRPIFGAKPCPTCKRVGCLDHLTIEQDYPDSAWNVERHDYGPKEEPNDD